MAHSSFTTPQGERAGYLGRPDGAGPWPGVVAIHEIFGLDQNMRDLSDRLAAMGYLTFAPDFFNGGNWRKCMRVAFRELKAGEGEFFDAIDAARAWLEPHDDCTGQVGVIGFCLGGGFALMVAPRYAFGAASVNYGEVPDDSEQMLRGSCPVVASYGGRDRSLRGHPERLEAALTTNGVDHDIKTYPAAGHSFLSTRQWPMPVRILGKLNGMNGAPHPESAADAWQRIDAFFRKHLA